MLFLSFLYDLWYNLRPARKITCQWALLRKKGCCLWRQQPLLNYYQMGLKSVKSLDVSRILRIGNDFLSMKDACVLVNDLVLDNCILSNRDFGAGSLTPQIPERRIAPVFLCQF